MHGVAHDCRARWGRDKGLAIVKLGEEEGCECRSVALRRGHIGATGVMRAGGERETLTVLLGASSSVALALLAAIAEPDANHLHG